MLRELIFLGCHSQFASYPYTFTSYSYSCKILQPYVAPTVRMHSDAVVSSAGSLLMKTVNNKWSTFASAGFGFRIHVNQPSGPLLENLCVHRSVKYEWRLIITHSLHVKITLQYCFSSGKENQDTQAENLSL